MPASSFTSRASGTLLHPTSLPGPFGVGDLGPQACAWVDTLAEAGQRWWQVLALGPTGFGDSPYQSLSAFAGNPLLVSPERLVEDDLLTPADLPAPVPEGRVDYGRAIALKARLLARAHERFKARARPDLSAAFDGFRAREAPWLDTFALFMALKDEHAGEPWTRWGPALAARKAPALEGARTRLAEIVAQHRFNQFLFFRQWDALKARANAAGVRIIGDAPIFVAHDSADLWAHPELFRLDASGAPTVVAGVPPDYFSATGQRWGNPLYEWEANAATGYRWWVERLGAGLRMFDALRLDHFIGFVNAWEIPAGEPTAERGCWGPGPGRALFDAASTALGPLSLIAEDLGAVTPAVDALRLGCGFPGMRVLQFAFGGGVEGRFRPFAYERNTVVYTGTHDNDTAVGWFQSSTPDERSALEDYLGHPTSETRVHWDLLRQAWASVADLAIAPVQDLLGLGREARMNVPGTATGNWRWRLCEADWPAARRAFAQLRALSASYGRLAPGPTTRGSKD
jgi:4-alpha-glucanotransferase